MNGCQVVSPQSRGGLTRVENERQDPSYSWGLSRKPLHKGRFLLPPPPANPCRVLFVPSSVGPGRDGEQQGNEPTALPSGNSRSHEPGSLDTFSSRESVCLLFQGLRLKTGVFRTAGIDSETDPAGAFPHMADTHLRKMLTVLRAFDAIIILSSAETIPHSFYISWYSSRGPI